MKTDILDEKDRENKREDGETERGRGREMVNEESGVQKERGRDRERWNSRC